MNMSCGIIYTTKLPVFVERLCKESPVSESVKAIIGANLSRGRSTRVNV